MGLGAETGNKAGSWTIAMAYAGSVLGIGLVSGREVVAAFTAKGEGWTSFLVVGLILSLGGGMFAASARRWGTSSYQEFLGRAGGSWGGKLLEGAVSLFLVAALSAGLAGGGELMNHLLLVPPQVTGAILVVLLLAAVRHGSAAFLQVSRLLVPIIFCAMTGVALLAGTGDMAVPLAGNGGLLASAFAYGFFNLLQGMVVLATFGKRCAGGKTPWIGGLAGGLLLTAVVYIVERAVRGREDVSLPLLHAAGKVNLQLGIIYAGILGLALLISMGGGIYGLAARFQPSQREVAVGMVILAAYLLSLFGLVTIVGYLYLIAGFIGLVIFILVGFAQVLEMGRETR